MLEETNNRSETALDGPLFPLFLYLAATVAVIAGILALSALLGQRHHERATDEPYESGVASTGTSHVRFDVKFYLVAMFFLIFDLEAVFLYAWAASVKESGWAGYVEVLIFTTVLAAGLIYLWKRGALEWGKKGGQGDRDKPDTGTRGRGEKADRNRQETTTTDNLIL